MAFQGYIRFPSIYQDRIVFVAEDDFWLVSDGGGRAERLTAGTDRVSYPHFSPDGELLAFVGREEGPSEVYVMPALGGPGRRLTFQSNLFCRVRGWSPDGSMILYASSAGQFVSGHTVIYEVSPNGGQPQQLPLGTADDISYGPQAGVVLGRNIDEPAYWKRYRGGQVGHLWCDPDGRGTFQRLLDLQGNLANPCWVGERIYFLSDHEGVGNIYSCTPMGEDVRRHSDHNDFYARNLSTDGRRLVYHAGADLYLFDPQAQRIRRLDIVLPSQRRQVNRKFVPAANYLDSHALHPQGEAIALTIRGKAFSMSNWEGAALQHGELDGVRYRFLEWLNDGKRLVAVCDAPGKEVLVIFDPESLEEPKMLTDGDLGRVVELAVSPTHDAVAIANHRNELIGVSLENGESAVIDHSEYDDIRGVTWSSDGTWIAYEFHTSPQKKVIRLADLKNGEVHNVTDPLLWDTSPSFDPEGKYLYFLGYRNFSPVHDTLQFDYGFPRGCMPYAITLRRDLRSPFIPEPKTSKESDTAEEEESEEKEPDKSEEEEQHEEESRVRKIEIDLEGITSRALPFPVTEALYTDICGIKGKVLFRIAPMQTRSHDAHDTETKAYIECFDFETQHSERLIDSVSFFTVSRDSKKLLYYSGRHLRLRVVKAGEKPPRAENSEQSGRENGLIDLNRIKVSVQPAAEWKQMFAEAWRLQREQFWTEDMSGVDWDGVYTQYAPLLERVGSRSELSDLIKELQGELGTSHASEFGGEYRRGNNYRQGFLGIDWQYDTATQRYRIARIVRGDPSNKEETSPLTLPGLNVSVGDAVLAINGQRVTRERSPQELLINQSEREVQLLLESVESKETRVITVPTLSSERDARYRDWVEYNRRLVHTQSEDRVGYIHIPDMSSDGFAEFHRSYLTEYDYPALIIDVRWNRGGSVASLLLEKLARRRIGYKFQRWGAPIPYPKESPRGPMVTLMNEHTASNGDIFCHSFRLMGLGPLIGTRTWGGVIGYTRHHHLVDNTETTQPEYASWFKDVGWDVENHGTDPDIEVEVAPHDYKQNTDPQLQRAIQEALRRIEECPSLEPKPGERPRRSRDRLH